MYKKVLFISILISCTLWGAEQKDNNFTISNNGVIQTADQTFTTWQDYYASDYFKQTGKRCLVKSVPEQFRSNVINNQSDCSMFKTVIKDEYWPTVTWIIPVVVHNIMDTDSMGYLDDERIQDQIDVLNEDYGAIEGTMGELGFDSKIRFELVDITRTVNNDWFNDRDEFEYKNQLAYDTDKYLNIYTNTASGYLGYSYFPHEAVGSVYDGVVVLYEAFSGRDGGFYPYDQGRTLTHEVGHYLGLFHPFEGYACYSGYTHGDLIEDTYPQSEESYGCTETETCNSPDNIHNYMNYTDDACMTEFTAEQSNRMICALLSYRPQLATVGNYAPVITSVPDTVGHVNELYQYTVTATDEENDAINFSLEQGPEGMDLDPLTGELTWLPGALDAGLYTVTILASDETGYDSQTFNLSILPTGLSIVADFVADTTTGNIPFAVQFEDRSLGEITQWAWDFGDSSTSDLRNPEHIYTVPGIYTVKLRVTGPFGADSLIQEDYITVLGQAPVAAFTSEEILSDKPFHVQFTDQSQGEITSWYWDFGDSSFSILQNPLHVYTKPGVYSVGLTVSGPAGMDSLYKENYIEIMGPGVIANFSAEPRIGSVPLAVQFADSSTDNVIAWYWDFGDGTTSSDQNPQHLYTEIGNYTVTLIAIGQTEFDTLKIENCIRVTEETPRAGFAADPLIGPWPLTVQFSDSSTGIADSWIWDFGDSTLSSRHNPEHTYELPGFYTVSQIVTGPGGADTLRKINYIQVLEKAPVAWFGAGETTGIIPFTVQFSDSSSGIITSWYWDFGDSTHSDEQNPVHEYAQVGDYTVALTVNGPGGANTATRELFIEARFPLAIDDSEAIPTEFKLNQNYPNPFNAGTTISYQLPNSEDVWLGIYDMNGKLVRVLEHGRRNPGHYQVQWNGLDNNGIPVSSGLYMVQIQAGSHREYVKALMLK